MLFSSCKSCNSTCKSCNSTCKLCNATCKLCNAKSSKIPNYSLYCKYLPNTRFFEYELYELYELYEGAKGLLASPFAMCLFVGKYICKRSGKRISGGKKIFPSMMSKKNRQERNIWKTLCLKQGNNLHPNNSR